MTSVAASLRDTRSGGPGDGSAAIHLGLVVEPIVDLVHLDTSAFYSECLARILVDGEAVLTPCEFVGDLEASGDIGLLDAAMVDLVLDALEFDPSLILGCNISPQTLAIESSWKRVLSTIGARPHLARRLILEVTENGPLDEIAAAPIRLTHAQALGCRIAIDDFGAGNATIRHLKGININWDIVKIDRSCFLELRKTPSGRDGLRSLFGLALCLAPTVIVEGIETLEHLAIARAAGLRWGQGFLFAMPAVERWKALDGEFGAELGGHFSRRFHAPVPRLGQNASSDRLVSKFHGSASDGFLKRLRGLLPRTWGGTN